MSERQREEDADLVLDKADYERLMVCVSVCLCGWVFVPISTSHTETHPPSHTHTLSLTRPLSSPCLNFILVSFGEL